MQACRSAGRASGPWHTKSPLMAGRWGQLDLHSLPGTARWGGVHDCVSVCACELPSRKLAGLCLFCWHSASSFTWRRIHSSRWKSKAREHAHSFILLSDFPLLVNLLPFLQTLGQSTGLSDPWRLIGETWLLLSCYWDCITGCQESWI